MLIQGIIDKNLYQFIDYEVESWEEAITISCQPLVGNGIVDEHFAKLLIEKVYEYGPYIVLLPNLAMPHTTENAPGVKDTAIAFTRFSKPVRFDVNDPSKDAQVFFTLAAENGEKHLKNMAGLFQILSEGDILEQVIDVKSYEDLLRIAKTLNDPKL